MTSPGSVENKTKEGLTTAPLHAFRSQSEAQEALVQLYLRLNGYLSSGFIAHAEERGDRAELDVLAVRNPWNREPERVIEPSPFLGLRKGVTDVLICEVKAGSSPAHFNDTLLNDERALASALRWVGLFEDDDLVRALVPKVQRLMRGDCPVLEAMEGINEGAIRIRALPCSPEKTGPSPKRWLLTHPELFRYIGACLNPLERAGCAVRYDFFHWGPLLAPIVLYFKRQEPGEAGDIKSLYASLRL